MLWLAIIEGMVIVALAVAWLLQYVSAAAIYHCFTETKKAPEPTDAELKASTSWALSHIMKDLRRK